MKRLSDVLSLAEQQERYLAGTLHLFMVTQRDIGALYDWFRTVCPGAHAWEFSCWPATPQGPEGGLWYVRAPRLP